MKLFFGARFLFIIMCLAFLFNLGYAATDAFGGELFLGVIKGNRVNVRAGDGLSFEVICQLNEKDEVTVVGQSKGWYKVKLPKKASVFIHKTNVTRKDATAIVNKDKSNVRTAATRSSTVIGQLNKGATVKVVKEYLDWYEIETPNNTFGWIHSDYVVDKDKAGVVFRKKDTLREKLTALNETYDHQLKKPLRQIELKGILEEYQEFVIQHQGSDEAEEAANKVSEIKLKIAELGHLKAKEEYEAKLKGISSPRPGEKPLASGIIEDVGKIYGRPSQYKLVVEGKPVSYLTSKKVDLNKYINFKVNVWGVKKEGRWDMPLIEADALEVIK